MEQLEGESDRGCMLVVGAWLDELLGHLLEASIVSHGPTRKALFEEPNAPLATFSGRINLAHGLGLIAQDEYEALHQIRSLRNTAAHFEKKKLARGFITGFEDETVASQVRALKVLDKIIVEAVENEQPARWLFNMAGAVLVGRLMVRPKETKARTPAAMTDWARYWATFIEKNKDLEKSS